ncbi:amidohydrolase [Blastopirellula marina]|uniref:Amidohydrolase n=1 Tax=Blastopirellula marina TaxID=124 RepID=A0A2S8GRD7_9BACT|nr:amidohydrolase [Blastopirellula marina]
MAPTSDFGRKFAELTWVFLILSCPTLAAAEPPQNKPATVREWVSGASDSLVENYRWFHTNPELSFQEEHTASQLAELLAAEGYQVTPGIGGHGLVALLNNGDGPTIMFRTDLDALPVTENTELVYASQKKVTLADGTTSGVMHACGHDIHMTNALGVARYMAHHKDQWQGTLMILGQPAEEKGAGAKAMLEDGLFERFPKPDYALALHVDPTMPVGTVGFRAGYAMANVDSVDIILKGKGGHGAYPHMTVDPIVQAAQLVMDLQTIVSREIAPSEPAVVTVGAIHGGTKHNVIGESCHLQLTVRSYGEETRKQLLDAIRRKANAVAESYRAEKPEITVKEGTPSLFNDQKLTGSVVETLRRTLGDDHVVPVDPSMGGEDFSRYGLAGVPIFMFRLGAVDARRLARYEQLGQKPPSLHSPLFYPDAEEALQTSVTASVAALLDLFGNKTDQP